MIEQAYAHDLVILTADNCIEQSVKGLISRRESLNIRNIDVEQYLRHPGKDPGVSCLAPGIDTFLCEEFEICDGIV